MYSQMVNTKKCVLMKLEIFSEMTEHWILKCTEKSRHNTEVKLQINFWTGTIEFSNTVFHHVNLWCKMTKKIQSPS